jgi:putative intracellular protease/amidase
MFKVRLSWLAALLALISVAAFSCWILTLPSAAAKVRNPVVSSSEKDTMLAALRPVGRDRPLVAVIGLNDATETTDYLMPTGILRRSGVADVMMLSTRPGPVHLYPTLKVLPDADIARFDAEHPEGADYVIVPAMSSDDDPAVMSWLQAQAGKGAKIIAICAGAKVVSAAGLLDGRRATTHWYYLGELQSLNPTINYVPNRRMVVDGNVATTTGITASMPMMLTLIEAIGGRPKAEEVARSLGLSAWDASHSSDSFKLTRGFVSTILSNRLAFWKREELGIRLEQGMDEVTLALAADAWSRTYRSNAVGFSSSGRPIVTANGIRVIADRMASSWPAERLVSAYPGKPPARALELTLSSVTERFGDRTADIVAMQLEHPRVADQYSLHSDSSGE